MFINRVYTPLFLLWMLLIPSLSVAETTNNFNIPLFTATYDLQAYSVKIATAVRQLRREKKNYILTTYSETVGVVSFFRNDTIKEESIW